MKLRGIVQGALMLAVLLCPNFALSYTLLEKIEEAKKAVPEELQHRLIRDPKYKKRTVYKTLEREVAVVGLKMQTGEIKKFIFKETVVIDPQKRPPHSPPAVIAKNNGCALIWRGGSRWGFKRNMLLQCGSKDFAIIKIAMPSLRAERKIVFDKRGKRVCTTLPEKIIFGSYTPYSPELHTPELVNRGRSYIERMVLEALRELNELGIPSHYSPEETLDSTDSIDFIRAMLVNEHMGHEKFKEAHADERSFAKLVEEYWVEAGANGPDTHGLSVSPAGAKGVAQFICPTYASILDEYPEVKLNPVFAEGMQNHVNAVKSMVTLFDSDRALRWSKKTKEICSVSLDMLEDCTAASYNMGAKRLNRIIAKRGADWDRSGPIVKKKRRYFAPSLPNETRIYLEKLRALRSYFLRAD